MNLSVYQMCVKVFFELFLELKNQSSFVLEINRSFIREFYETPTFKAQRLYGVSLHTSKNMNNFYYKKTIHRRLESLMMSIPKDLHDPR
jgi:hypothetical protein